MCFVCIAVRSDKVLIRHQPGRFLQTETQCVYCAVRTGYLYIISVEIGLYSVSYVLSNLILYIFTYPTTVLWSGINWHDLPSFMEILQLFYTLLKAV